MNTPLVTVICACYNQASFVIDSLESVKSQTYSNLEIIIWDDASKDNSSHIISEWIAQNPQLDIQFIKHQTNKGICKSLNECFLLAKGKYIQILALDDILQHDKISRHVNLLESSEEKYALVFSDAMLIDSNGNCFQNRFIAWHLKYLSLRSGNFYDQLLDGNFIPAMSVLLKKNVIDVVGLWDEDLPYEDYDMFLRIAQKYDFLFDEELSVKYRLHSSNTHKSGFNNSLFKIFLKHSQVEKAQKKLHFLIESGYLANILTSEAKIYYDKFGKKGILDYMIYYSFPRVFYRITKRILNAFPK